MILSNSAIIEGLREKWFAIDGLENAVDPSRAPFNTSAVDLRLSNKISIPEKGQQPVQLDLRQGKIAPFLNNNSKNLTISEDQPYSLKPNTFILANTLERVNFPLCQDDKCTSFAARVEGKSSLARCGLLVHFTAPTIHAGFEGPITLEIINLGPFAILLTPSLPICQLIIEQVSGQVTDAPNQFRGQTQPAGVIGN